MNSVFCRSPLFAALLVIVDVLTACTPTTIPPQSTPMSTSIPILTSTFTPYPSPTGSPANDKSATTAKVLIQNQMKYYIANPDGSQPFLLYSGEQSLLMASLSPDATKFAYFWGNFVYIQDIENGNVTRINQQIIGSMGGQIRWSPDGTRLAITCANDQQQILAICSIDIKNGQMEVLVNENNTDEFCASSAAYIMLQDWSQDGSTMVYTCFIIPVQGQKADFTIYLFDLASKTSKRVFDGRTKDTIWGIGSASISPDKNYLLITGHHQDYVLQVFLLDLTNSTLTQLTNGTDYDSEALAWRMDGTSFYLHKTYRQIPYPESNFVMNINGFTVKSMDINGKIIK